MKFGKIIKRNYRSPFLTTILMKSSNEAESTSCWIYFDLMLRTLTFWNTCKVKFQLFWCFRLAVSHIKMNDGIRFPIIRLVINRQPFKEVFLSLKCSFEREHSQRLAKATGTGGGNILQWNTGSFSKYTRSCLHIEIVFVWVLQNNMYSWLNLSSCRCPSNGLPYIGGSIFYHFFWNFCLFYGSLSRSVVQRIFTYILPLRNQDNPVRYRLRRS